MKDISKLIEIHIPFEEPPVEKGTEKITSEWQLIMKDFLDELNPSKEAWAKSQEKPFKPYTPGGLAGMMKRAGVSKNGYRNLLTDCKKAPNFSAFFHWKLKQLKK